MILDVGDIYKDFIKEKMVQYGDEYSEEDFEAYFNNPHTNIFSIADGEPIAFGCIMHYNNNDFLCYTWHDKTFRGIKSYLLGIKHIVKRFKNIKADTFGQYILDNRS